MSKLTEQELSSLADFAKSDVWYILKRYITFKISETESIKGLKIRDGEPYSMAQDLSRKLGKTDAFGDIIRYVDNKAKQHEYKKKEELNGVG